MRFLACILILFVTYTLAWAEDLNTGPCHPPLDELEQKAAVNLLHVIPLTLAPDGKSVFWQSYTRALDDTEVPRMKLPAAKAWLALYIQQTEHVKQLFQQKDHMGAWAGLHFTVLIEAAEACTISNESPIVIQDLPEETTLAMLLGTYRYVSEGYEVPAKDPDAIADLNTMTLDDRIVEIGMFYYYMLTKDNPVE